MTYTFSPTVDFLEIFYKTTVLDLYGFFFSHLCIGILIDDKIVLRFV